MADRILDPGTGCYIREMSGRDGTETSKDATSQRTWLVYDNHDPLVCRTALLNQRLAIGLDQYANLNLANLNWKRHAGGEKWAFTADYATVPEVGGYTVSIDTTGATGKQTEAYVQSRFVATGETNAREYGTTVNVQNNEPQGVDRTIPALKLNINARIPKANIPDPITYAKTVAGLTGTVNNAPYLGFAAGELLFMGASGDIVTEEPQLTFTFGASANLSGHTIGPITGITKAGHDYIWFDYKKVKDQTSGLQISKPRAAYVSRVYTWADFSPLGIT